uniref:Xylulose kinase-1 n=1 Tax=Tanacetum cinerariifolium TaxID=118510 RepID=A0A6L2KW21_TANCI|nr:hypothetical protein [Tanacetum cinerariifolium]
MVNATIYVSCIKQICIFVSIKNSNDVVRLQALIDRKKVIITEDTIQQALRLDDADGVDCLSNEEIFTKLARMGFEKPSTKLTFYKEAVEDAAEDEDDDHETCATLTKKVANLEQDKISQDIEITKLKQRVKRGKITELDADEDVTLVDAKKDMNAAVQGRLPESQEKVYHLDLEHAKKVVSMHDTDEAEPAEVEEVIEVVTAAKLMTEVVTTAATTITAAQVPKASAPRRRRGDEAFARQLEAELNANINWDDVIEQVKTKEKQDNTAIRYQALKRKPITKAQAKKNMMIYLKNMAGFKMDFFKGMTYNDIRPIFEKHYNSIKAFLEEGEKEIEEEGNKRKGGSLN